MTPLISSADQDRLRDDFAQMTRPVRLLFFMHVKYSSKLTWIVISASVFFLLILFMLTMNDYLTRGWQSYG